MSIRVTYFVHSTTIDNNNDIATGWNDGELSVEGIHQAVKLGKIVNNQEFDRVYCSDLGRAVESANIGFSNKYNIVSDSRLRESDFGDFTNKPSSSFKDNMISYVKAPYPNGNSLTDVKNNVSSFIDMVKKETDLKHIAIVSHQAPQLAFEVILNDKTWKEAIEDDWRRTGEWKPGWKYTITIK